MSRPVPKPTGKRYRKTSEMLEDIGASQESIDSVKEVEAQIALPLLAGLRVSKKLTQKELAQAIGCSQGRISKLETARDEELRLQDFVNYTRATNQEVWITIGSSTIAQHIKLLTRALRQAFEELTILAGEDEQIRKGVDDFLDEILVETGR
jgi:transcriptional regulator with XRE-family HTH domain